jgi:hypothetical protein
MKTADLTLEDQLLKSGVNKFTCNVASCKGVIVEAMETYATQQTSDLTTQLAKANFDKERLGELLKEVYESQIANCELCKEDGLTVTASLHQENADRIKLLLTDCGITL